MILHDGECRTGESDGSVRNAAADATAMAPGKSMPGVIGVVLAGTHSWQNCSLEQALPRPLAPIVNKPLIAYVLSWFRRSGIRAVNVCGNSDTKTLCRHLSKDDPESGVPSDIILDYYEDVSPRGPAGCVRDAGFGSGCEMLVAVDGTIVPQVDIARVLAEHKASDAALTVVVSPEDPRAGADEDSWAPTGVYVFSRRALERIPPMGYQDIKEALIPRLNRHGEVVRVFRVAHAPPRVAGVDSYLAVNDWVLERHVAIDDRFSDYLRKGDARIHKSATVDSTARLIGPIVLGAGAVVERDATIIGPTSIGTESILGAGTVVSRTSAWDHCYVGRGAVLDRCILMHRSSIRSDSAHRYVVFSETRPRFRRFGRLAAQWFSHAARPE